MASFRSKLWRFTKLSAATGAGGAVVGISSWKYFSRNSYFEPFTPDTDALFHLPLLKVANPHNNPSLDDSCVHKVPYSKLKPELLEDQKNGGSGLITAFTQGMWGGYGFAIQRKLENKKARNDDNRNDMWSAEQCLSGKYEKGDCVTDHMMVIDKTQNTVLMRGGPPPRSTPEDQPRDLDNIGEMRVDLNDKEGVAEFRFKNIFFSGAGGPKDHPPFPQFIAFLHYEYVKLLVESGVSRCVK